MNRNKGKVKWGVVLGKPTEKHTNPDAYQHLIGTWREYSNGGSECVAGVGKEPTLFPTKKEAEEHAERSRKSNTHWNFHAKKWNPHKEKAS